jgi:hypothetical protein
MTPPVAPIPPANPIELPKADRTVISLRQSSPAPTSSCALSDYSRWRHGFTMRTPQPAKSRSLRVASAMSREAPMDAI